ncbi:hypothetical protein AGABI2DRAFT_134923 [Agaricus bisporus var. bisporus H97]|uniref:hypothetical protein n=1 Tax=Agaricus bisporus var. bisporus (strain H97 / ATCC MYA-4626 / FGSC 10389) TaxID=936046 RepID=UPI00029F5E31|nr:hypothetical protein AGABI2DRAFT_134923 [Agaricus bisporus var. bisporus H97]EKV49410.1 hypothetical protein AGABI2DRAFT_134923 [Agaricus bisporus var. bisporus H97]
METSGSQAYPKPSVSLQIDPSSKHHPQIPKRTPPACEDQRKYIECTKGKEKVIKVKQTKAVSVNNNIGNTESLLLEVEGFMAL